MAYATEQTHAHLHKGHMTHNPVDAASMGKLEACTLALHGVCTGALPDVWTCKWGIFVFRAAATSARLNDRRMQRTMTDAGTAVEAM